MSSLFTGKLKKGDKNQGPIPTVPQINLVK